MALAECILVRDCAAIKGTARKSIMFAIASRIGPTGFAWPNEQTIAEDSGASLRSVKRYLKYLRREAFLFRTREKGRRSWCYRLGPAFAATETVPTAKLAKCQTGIAVMTTQPANGANLTPEDKKEVPHNKAKRSQKWHRPVIDYSREPLPDVYDYCDINQHDPILVAIKITGERAITGWGHWVKRLSQAKSLHGEMEGTKIFRDCLHELFGLSKEPNHSPLGAVLNKLLRDRLGDLPQILGRVA